MSVICLVGDSKSQLNMPALAENMFRSALFGRAKQYAKVHANRWYILSARYGLLEPNTLIEPYDITIDDLEQSERFQIAQHIMTAFIRQPITTHDRVIVLAKATYRDVLAPVFQGRNIQTEYPLERKGIVQQMRWLEAAVK